VSDFVVSPQPLTVVRTRTQRVRDTIGAYVRLTKPRVIELLLVTTVPAMVLAANDVPALDLVAAVLLGGTLAAGGANTINCWIERDRDSVMHRTRHRPLPNGEITPQRALVFGLALEVAAFAVLWPSAGILAAVLALSATLFYVFVYTIWLKPRSTQNIVIGGAAGAVPVLVGWAAVTGSLAAPAWLLFALVFFWTPPHFWALAIRYRDDYAAASIPMLPVVDGIQVAARHILGYSVVVAAVSLGLPFVSDVGVLYTATAALLGVGLIVQAVRLCKDATPERAIRLFGFSNLYLALLFAAVAVDVIIRAS
jgi:protoheme IX farnesyltransferase